MPLRLCLPSGPPTTQCCISSFVRGSVSPPLTHYTMRLQIYFPFLSVPGNKDWKGHWDQDGQRLVLRLFLHVYKEALADLLLMRLLRACLLASMG
ncbi:unnamed protein product [Brassica rapa subsp. narinosa]